MYACDACCDNCCDAAYVFVVCMRLRCYCWCGVLLCHVLCAMAWHWHVYDMLCVIVVVCSAAFAN